MTAAVNLFRDLQHEIVILIAKNNYGKFDSLC